MDWSNKKILITGGTGSVGRVLTEILIGKHNPSIIIFSHSEQHQYEMKLQLNSKFQRHNVTFRLGDIGDYQDVELAMRNCDTVIHLAAMKHILACEENPLEAIGTNIDGACNIYEAAMICEPEIVLGMSTDKAYGRPLSLYGYTKAVMEQLFLKNAQQTEGQTKFCIMRCGNILDSQGSVTKLWREQVAKGESLTVTDPSMTRFWISLPRIARFIIETLESANEVSNQVSCFIPKMKACSVGNLASLFSDRQKIIGKKKYERQHEILDAGYRSNAEGWQLTNEELRKLLKENEEYL